MLKNKIVLVPFPFDDLSSQKVRPAVCLTNSIGQYNHVVLAFITSRIPEEPASSDIILKSDEAEFENTGLHVSSTLRLHRLMTVTTNLIRRELGTLSPDQQVTVKIKLQELFGLT